MNKLIISLAAAILSLPVTADEGMWLLPLLKGQKFPEMQALGLKLQDDFAYEKVECDTQDRLFPERYTIFPIPFSELQTNILCEQNDLWK